MAFLRLRLTPGAFWALSAAEWGALCGALGEAAPAPMGRADLNRLMEGT